MLLKGVNDNVETMKQLVHRLLMMRVKPYYLYQCDPISGSSHFRTSGGEGSGDHRRIARTHDGLRGADLRHRRTGGGGQDPPAAGNVIGRDGDYLLLRNFEGKTFRYPDPEGA